MKDHIEIDHLTEYDAFRWTETKLWTLKHGSKSIQTSLILRQRPPKPYKLLKFFISFVTTVKSRHALLFERSWDENHYVCLFQEYHGSHENFKSLYGFGGCRLKIRDVCMDFEAYFKVHNLVSVHLKSIILGQMTNLNMIFHVVMSVYQLVKIRNSPQFPAEFRNGLCQPIIGIWLSTCMSKPKNAPIVITIFKLC